MFKLILFFLIVTINTAHAYLGPGMGGGLVAAMIGIIFALFALIFGIIWFPLKRFFKNKKIKKNTDSRNDKEK